MKKKAIGIGLDQLAKVTDKAKPILSGASSGSGRSKGKQLELNFNEEEKIILGSKGKKAREKDTDQLLKEILEFASGKGFKGKPVSPETERAYKSFFNRTMREP
jgi:hypothetical protein